MKCYSYIILECFLIWFWFLVTPWQYSGVTPDSAHKNHYWGGGNTVLGGLMELQDQTWVDLTQDKHTSAVLPH